MALVGARAALPWESLSPAPFARESSLGAASAILNCNSRAVSEIYCGALYKRLEDCQAYKKILRPSNGGGGFGEGRNAL